MGPSCVIHIPHGMALFLYIQEDIVGGNIETQTTQRMSYDVMLFYFDPCSG